ncbi:Hypothetical protein AA314_09186 [Archangium gephyra]|uniref:Uncharacterized protein n=1 Tax=Archangium gephyra TaxID=48 RepID=A0AAC8TJ53_9BACT|nr:Hypothetical protein AA314_09186 [Archangium gephyra]
MLGLQRARHETGFSGRGQNSCSRSWGSRASEPLASGGQYARVRRP